MAHWIGRTLVAVLALDVIVAAFVFSIGRDDPYSENWKADPWVQLADRCEREWPVPKDGSPNEAFLAAQDGFRDCYEEGSRGLSP